METIKNWLLKRDFVFNYVQEQIKGAERSFATRLFKNARDDVKEEYQENIEERAKEMADKMLNDLLSPVDTSKILTVTQNNILKIGGEDVDAIRLSNIVSEAEFFAQSELWKILYETPKLLAQQTLFKDDGKSEVLHAKGRAILYTLDTQRKNIDTLLQLRKK